MARVGVVRTGLILGLIFALGAVAARPATGAIEEPERLWTVGEHAFQDGLYSLSRRVLERLIQRFPTDRRVPEATLLLGKTRFSQRDFSGALESFRAAESFSPVPGRPGEARFWEAEALFRMDRFEDAREAYGRVLSDYPDSPLAADALYGRAWSNRRLKKNDRAVADFREVLDSYPQSTAAPSASYYLARTLMEMKRPDDAVSLLRAFPSKYPGHALVPQARYALGQALLDAGETQEGLAELRAFIAAYPDSDLTPQARRLVADTVIRGGNKTELAAEYKRLMAQSPPSAEALYEAGVLASRLGRSADAQGAWTRLRKEFPDHALASRAALDLAQVAYSKNAFKDASALAQAASKSSVDGVRGEALLMQGESELRLKRYAPALQAFQSALTVNALEPGLRFRALAGSGLALEEQQKWVQAAHYYDEVAAKSPDKTLRAWAKERRAAIAAKLKPSDAKPAPKSSPPKGSAPKSQTPQETARG